MNIFYRNSPTFMDATPVQWLPGTLVNNNTALTDADGKYVSVQPDGSYQQRDALGPWEACSLNPSNNTVTFAGTGIAYPIPIKGR